MPQHLGPPDASIYKVAALLDGFLASFPMQFLLSVVVSWWLLRWPKSKHLSLKNIGRMKIGSMWVENHSNKINHEPASPSLGFQGCHCHPWKICTFVLRYRLGISQKSFCPSHWGGLKANPVHFFRITIASLHGSRIQRAIKAFTSWNSDWIVSKSLTRHFNKSHDLWKKHWSHYVM